MRRIILSINLMLFTTLTVVSQTGVIKGKVTDHETGEELFGSTLQIQGTTKGAISDYTGNFLIEGLAEGNYNLVVTNISYAQQIIPVRVVPEKSLELMIKLKPETTSLEEVVVTQVRKTETELSLLSSIKSSDVILNGISSQQISRTQDKDAAEVIRRVPGISITNGKFVIVRGLIERYNSVLLNGSSAPSFEADKRAFSFDAIPSGMISNILIYNSPAPHLPADFAGATIDIITRNNVDKNEFSVSYSAGYRQNTTLNSDFRQINAGRLDWIGVNNGTHTLPAGTPSTSEYNELFVWDNLNEYNADMTEVTRISRAFNKNFTTFNKPPLPDQGLSINYLSGFTTGKTRFGTITSINYKTESLLNNVIRREYNYVDTLNYRFNYNDLRSVRKTSIGLIHNWLITYKRNQRIEFRNLVNFLGESSVSDRSGDFVYNSESALITNLRYNSRFLYTGQVTGKQVLSNDDMSSIEWLAGYSRIDNNEPDNRRVKYSRDIDSSNAPYLFNIDREVNINNGGRLTQKLYENIITGKIDYKQEFFLFSSDRVWSLKIGAFRENKQRFFSSRLIGLVAPRGTQYLDLDRSLPIEEILEDQNFYFIENNPAETGIAYKDGTQIRNSYEAESNLTAGYLGLRIPISKYLDIYAGARGEHITRLITGFYEAQPGNDTLDIVRDTLSIFPSMNITLNLNEKHVIRFSYGKTINRPEFREISNTVYEDFDLVALVHGNPELKDAYIVNYDLRYEWYPDPSEIVSLAGFYKVFSNPVEIFQIPAGTGFDYMPYNTESAYSLGAELDIRKIILNNENYNLSIVFNASVISSEISTKLAYARQEKRIMQGQSPYLINFSAYYINEHRNFNVNLTFNRVGKRIVYSGTTENPDTWELPRNLLDITFSKKFGKYFELRLGIKDLLNDPVRLVQYHGQDESIEAVSLAYTPGSKYTLGIGLKF